MIIETEVSINISIFQCTVAALRMTITFLGLQVSCLARHKVGCQFGECRWQVCLSEGLCMW